jgi:anti-sigma B factor antagonist
MLNISKFSNEGALTIAVSGRLDANTAPQLEEELNTSLDGVTDLTFDFKGLDYVSSAGLRLLLSAQKHMAKQGKMRLISVCDAVMEVFDMTGFSDILTIDK